MLNLSRTDRGIIALPTYLVASRYNLSSDFTRFHLGWNALLAVGRQQEGTQTVLLAFHGSSSQCKQHSNRAPLRRQR